MQIGNVLGRLGHLTASMSKEGAAPEAGQPTIGTDLPALSIGSLDLTSLPERLDDTMLAAVEQVARAPLPALPPVDEQHFAKCLRAMQAVLPRQRTDEMGGELIVRMYMRQLGDQPREAINFLADRATVECQWFPTIAQCLAILGRWRRGDEAVSRRNKARGIAASEWMRRFDEARAAVLRREIDQDGIDALPERIKAILEVRCLLWRCDCGSYVLRPLHPDENNRNEREIAD